MNEHINIESLKSSVISLNSKRDELKEIINNELIPILSEFNIDSSEYKTLFASLYNRIDSLSSILNNSVINNYKETLDDINSLFSGEFNQKLTELLSNKTE